MCPPYVDQTERSSQKWQILAPRRRKIHKLVSDVPTYGLGPSREFLLNDQSYWDAWSKLAVQAAPLPLHTHRSQSRSRRRTTPLSRLESLPSELIASILEDTVLSKSEVIALGLTSETLWLHVLQHVEKDCSRTKPPMAGVEIACTGTYLTDLPESFVQEDLAKSSVEAWRCELMCEARKINWAAACSYDVIGKTPEEAWGAAFKAGDGLAADIPAGVTENMTAELLSRCSMLRGSEPDALWILRNLTTREYVRCRPGGGPVGRRGYVDCPDGGNKVRLDDVLLLRICWTKLAMRDDHEELGISRGQWAGHRFDIVPCEQFHICDGWKDCTDEILEQAVAVAKRYFCVDDKSDQLPEEDESKG